MKRAFLFVGLLAWGSSAPGQEWKSNGGDSGGTRFSPLRQIDRSNVTRLKPAWVYHTGDLSDGTKWPTRSAFESTPLAVEGVLYLTTPFSRLVALDEGTGREIWSFDPKIDRRQATNLFVNRGAAYWSKGSKRRILLGTIDGRLFSIVAETGRPDDAFGNGGWIDLRDGAANRFPGRGYGMTSPPAVYKDLMICGSLVPDGEPRGPAGDVRAFDVRTGKLAWIFHTVPQDAEFGNETWPKNGWQERGGLNAWAPLSIDTERGIVFLPLTSPATDFYGGDRKGAGLFGDSLVALEAATGKRLWHFQTVHHNLWDYDLPAQPVLVKVRREGILIDAVAQVTKTGFTFVFDRASGEPLFPIEEVRVPASEVPGEQAWPTQPRPLKPPSFARQKMSPDELTGVTPESRAYCAKLIEGAVFGEIFTPAGLRPTILFPGTNGGANWGGASFDPETHTLYVNSMDVGMLYHMVKRPDGSTIPYRPQGSGTANSRFWDSNLMPCQKPPWGFLTAIDLDRGEFRWRAVLGVVDELLEKGLAPTGSPNVGGSLVTAGGLVFIGATNDSRFRAFDKDNGRELWMTRLPASAHASPMTYLDVRSGKQFVVIAAGGGNKYNATYSDSLVAFTLQSGGEDQRPIVQYHHESEPERADSTRGDASIPSTGQHNSFSHRQHASLKLLCTSCHASAETGSRAGLPTSAACMPCHRSTVRPAEPAPKLPDFVLFSHARHHGAHIACAACHGDIGEQNALPVSLSMNMAACISCHRANHASTVCTVCHELSQ